MIFLFDNALCEEVVEADLCDSSIPRKNETRAAFRKASDSIYKQYSPQKRSAPFNALYQKYFDYFGHKKRIEALFSEMESAVGPLLNACWFAKALTPDDEGAQLSEDRTRLAFRIRPKTVREHESLAYLVRHELIHVRDMLDPALGHGSDVPLASRSPAEESLFRDRYRTLWDLSVDGRLERLGRLPTDVRKRRRAEFRALFRNLKEECAERVVESLWSGPALSDASLRKMVLGAAPLCEALGVPFSGEVDQAEGKQVLGSACPLCRFPTFEWGELTDSLIEAVKEEFPQWQPSLGICSQCADRYVLTATLASGGRHDKHATGEANRAVSSLPSKGGCSR